MGKLELTMTNWQYKGLRIYRDPDGNLYIYQHGRMYPIDTNELPETIRANVSQPLADYQIHGKIGQNQE